MTFNVYAIKDNLVNKFYSPNYYPSDEEALRDFKFKMNDIKQWKFNASDYTFHRLGTFDDESGIFTTGVEQIANGRSVIDD